MKSRAARSIASTIASSILVGGICVACSGAASDELFGTPTATQSATNPTPGTSGAAGTSGAPSTSGSVGTSGSPGSSGTSGSGTSGGTSGTSGSPPKDAGTDTSVPFKSPGIFCGADQVGNDVYCTPTSKECCATSTGPDPADKSFECVSSNGGGGLGQCQGQPIKCDDRTDCPSGQVCCGAFDQNQGYQRVQCQASCNDSPIPGLSPVRFCDGNAPTDECVDIGKKCTASGSLPGFHVCK